MAYPDAIRRIQAMPYGIRGFSAFCRLLKNADWSQFKLAPFQRFRVGFYFAGVIACHSAPLAAPRLACHHSASL